MLNGATFLRRELMIRVVRAFDAGTLADEIDHIAVHLRPKNGDSSRCCIYHDRAVIKYRLMALLGVSVEEETDEMKRLVDYLAEKESGAVPEHEVHHRLPVPRDSEDDSPVRGGVPGGRYPQERARGRGD